MTILDGGPALPPAEPPPPQPIPEHFQAEPPDAGRASQWRTSWRLALRMARRDVRRNKGRTALAFAMIFLPTMLLAATVVLVATSDLSGARGIPYRFGDATAQATYQGYKLEQDPDPDTNSWPADRSAGTDKTGETQNDSMPADAQRAAVEAATGGTAYPFLTASIRYRVGDRLRSDEAWLYDPSKLTGRATLVSGRWPSGPDEAIVTEYGLTRGLPSSGPLTMSIDMAVYGNPDANTARQDRPLTVVGVASAKAAGYQAAVIAPPQDSDLEGEESLGENTGIEWFVMGSDAVTWAKVKELNAQGFTVASASVIADPPADSDLYPPDEEYPQTYSEATYNATITAFGYAFMAVVIALLVAPAFAVSAARSRRSLALAASNGARTGDLRRTVLAQALVIALAATLASALLGVAGVALARVIARRVTGYEQLPPVAVPWWSLLGMIVIGLLSAVVAALIPANRLGRLDIVSVMRGQVASRRPNLIVFGLGLVVTLVSAVALLGSTLTLASADPSDPIPRESIAAVTGLTLIGGSVFLVPMALAGLAKLGGLLPTSGSMAARDMGRHRARSAPTVAAVMAAASALTLGLVLAQAAAINLERTYTAKALVGEGVLTYYGDDPDLPGRIKADNPSLVFTDVKTLDDESNTGDGETSASIRVIPPGCTPEQTVANPEYDATVQAFYEKYPDGPPAGVTRPVNPCSFDEQQDPDHSYEQTVLVMPSAWLIARLKLNDEQARALRSGGMIYRTPKPSEQPKGNVQLALLLVSYPFEEGETTKVAAKQQWSAPVIAVPKDARTAGALVAQSRAIASDGPAAKGLKIKEGTSDSVSSLVTTADGSQLTPDQVDEIAADLEDSGEFRVETGHADDSTQLISAIVLGLFAVLVLLVVLTTTALSLAEQQRDQSTLAAVGATRGTRRVMAGVQAFLIAATGAVAGLVVGLIPGVALSYLILAQPLDTNIDEQPGTAFPSLASVASTLSVPWLSLTIMALGIPLIAGLFAALAIRKAPMVARRAT